MHCPLTGMICQNPKNFKINEIVDGKLKILNLCVNCAQSYFTSDKISLNEIPSSVSTMLDAVDETIVDPDMVKLSIYIKTPIIDEITDEIKEQLKQNIPPKEKSCLPPCPKCESIFEEIVASGRLGCATCWKHFAPEMNQICLNIHGASKHVGKKIKKPKVKKEKNIDQNIVQLQKKLDKAIKKDNFEKAKIYQKSIDRLNEIKIKKEEINQQLKQAFEKEDYEKTDILVKELTDLMTEYSQIVIDSLG